MSNISGNRFKMVRQEFYVVFLIAAIAAAQSTQTQNKATPTESTNKLQQTQTHQSTDPLQQSTRTGRIMKILKDPAPLVKRNRAPPPPNLQPRRDRFPPNQQRPMPITYHRPLYGGGPRNQMLRRVQNGPPPPNAALRPQQAFQYEPVKGTRYAPGHKDNLPPPHFGKGAVYRPQFGNAPHPNSLANNNQGHSQQYIQNFKASPQYSGNAIVRPVPDFAQFNAATAKGPHAAIKQYPLPQQHPQHQHQAMNQLAQTNTAPQTFPNLQQQPAKQYTEALLKSADNQAPQSYSVYEDPEISEHASLQFNSQQNPLAFNPNFPTQQHHQQQQQQQQPSQHHPQHVTPAAKDAEDYLKFMSTNEYFLPKFNPNYKKIDEEKDLRQFKQFRKQQEAQSQLYSKTLPPNGVDNGGGSAVAFREPMPVSKLFYQGDPSPVSTIVRGSYQTGSNVFVVNSDGNKAIKHIVPSSLATQMTTTPSIAAAGPFTNARYNSLHHRTPEPIRFEFTERDAVMAAHTNSPPLNVGNQHYQSSAVPTPAGIFHHNRPISVNEIDADPEDGDDMQEAGTDFYGRVPIRSSTENSESDNKSASSTPPTEQKDTEDYCESICANVQDENAEIICGSDGYMYTGEAQMECYASCLHIDVTIQGKGSCSAR